MSCELQYCTGYNVRDTSYDLEVQDVTFGNVTANVTVLHVIAYVSSGGLLDIPTGQQTYKRDTKAHRHFSNFYAKQETCV
jgi:hypothetical protein